MVSRYVDAGATVHSITFDLGLRPNRLPAVLEEIRVVVDEVDPDVIHLHNFGPAMLARLALGRRHPIPRVFQVPGPLHMEHYPYRRTDLATAGLQDRWIASSEYTQRLYLSAGVAPGRVSMSYYGTDIDSFALTSTPLDLRSELGLSDSTRIIGMVAYMYAPKRHLGQMRGLKGHEDLIDAVSIGLSEGADIAVVFVGGAWNGAVRYEEHLRKLADQRCGKRAFFLGTRPDVSELYRNFEVSAHPSLSENVGGTVESFLCGVPAVATNVGGFPELVKEGETGWLVPAHHPRALWRALSAALSDPMRASAMAEAGRTLARDLFDVRHTSTQIRQTYERLVKA
jgi:glycosyltransferase involved in cell wall biosynthesis